MSPTVALHWPDTYITFGYCWYCMVLHHIELIANGQIFPVAEWLSFLHLVYHTSDSVPITQHNPIPGTKHFHNQQKKQTTDSNIRVFSTLVAALEKGDSSYKKTNSQFRNSVEQLSGDLPETDRFSPLRCRSQFLDFSTFFFVEQLHIGWFIWDDVGIFSRETVGKLKKNLPSDECMQKDALRHKVPELSRGFPERNKLLRWLVVVFLGQLPRVAPGNDLENNCELFIGWKSQSIPI